MPARHVSSGGQRVGNVTDVVAAVERFATQNRRHKSVVPIPRHHYPKATLLVPKRLRCEWKDLNSRILSSANLFDKQHQSRIPKRTLDIVIPLVSALVGPVGDAAQFADCTHVSEVENREAPKVPAAHLRYGCSATSGAEKLAASELFRTAISRSPNARLDNAPTIPLRLVPNSAPPIAERTTFQKVGATTAPATIRAMPVSPRPARNESIGTCVAYLSAASLEVDPLKGAFLLRHKAV
jgi:hypothetical protein